MGKTNSANPFIVGGLVPPEKFIGRGAAIDDFVNHVGAVTSGCWSVVGWRRIGKTALLKYIVARGKELLPDGAHYAFAYVDLSRNDCATRAGLMRAIRAALLDATAGNLSWDEQDAGDEVAWRGALEQLRDKDIRPVLCLDEFEAMFTTTREEEFPSGYLNGWRALANEGLITFITASHQPLVKIYEASDAVSAFYNIFNMTALGVWTTAEVAKFYRYYCRDIPDDNRALIAELSGNHPFYTQMAANIAFRLRHAAPDDDIENELRDKFTADAEDKMYELWRNCRTNAERDTMRYYAGVQDVTPNQEAVRNLRIDSSLYQRPKRERLRQNKD